jgi:hypothetical protein
MMRGGFAYPVANLKTRIKNEISWKLQQRAAWDKVHHLDPLVLNAVKKRNPTYAENVFLIPEAIEATREPKAQSAALTPIRTRARRTVDCLPRRGQ